MKKSKLEKAVDKFVKLVRKATLHTNRVIANENKDKWQTGTPEENKQLSFRSDNTWHNGWYENGAFYIIGDRTKTAYKADTWYYKA